MTHILENEVLYWSTDNKTIIYKTYSKELNQYGLLKNIGQRSRYADTTYLHIFPFQEEKAAAITSDNKYVWINTELQESEMDVTDKVIWECEAVKNASCNCVDKIEVLGCELCEGGEIFNTLNWRRLNNAGSKLRFEYDTEYTTYSIIITPSSEFTNYIVDEVWEEADLQRNIRLFVQNHKEQLLVLPMYLHVCVLSRNSHFTGVKLQPCSINVEMEKNLAIDLSQQNSFFSNYNTFINNKK